MSEFSKQARRISASAVAVLALAGCGDADQEKPSQNANHVAAPKVAKHKPKRHLPPQIVSVPKSGREYKCDPAKADILVPGQGKDHKVSRKLSFSFLNFGPAQGGGSTEVIVDMIQPNPNKNAEHETVDRAKRIPAGLGGEFTDQQHRHHLVVVLEFIKNAGAAEVMLCPEVPSGQTGESLSQ